MTITAQLTQADLASAFQRGYKLGEQVGALDILAEIEQEEGPVGRFIYRLQQRWVFLR